MEARGSFVLDDARLEQPGVYISPEGRPCAPYVTVHEGTQEEVGAIIKGYSLSMSEVVELDPEALAADGVEVPAHVAGKMYAYAEMRSRDWRHSAMKPHRELVGLGPELSPETMSRGEEGQVRIDRMVKALVEERHQEVPSKQPEKVPPHNTFDLFTEAGPYA